MLRVAAGYARHTLVNERADPPAGPLVDGLIGGAVRLERALGRLEVPPVGRGVTTRGRGTHPQRSRFSCSSHAPVAGRSLARPLTVVVFSADHHLGERTSRFRGSAPSGRADIGSVSMGRSAGVSSCMEAPQLRLTCRWVWYVNAGAARAIASRRLRNSPVWPLSLVRSNPWVTSRPGP